MAEPVEPRPPSPSAPAYLPRLWKATPEPEELELTPPVPAKKKRSWGESGGKSKAARANKKKKAQAAPGDGTSAINLEETPVLDTYEARQRARWIIGGILGGVGLLALFLAVRTFRGDGAEAEHPLDVAEPHVAIEGRPNPEVEARTLVENARQADRLGKTKAAVLLLDKVVGSYQGTAAARDAMHAIDRQRRNLPLFGVDLPEQATGPRPPTPAKVAVAAASPGPVAAAVPSPPVDAIPGPIAPAPPRGLDAANPSIIGQGTAAAPSPVKPLPLGFRQKPGTTIHPSGWPLQIVSDRDGGAMVLVPGGSFLMGREDGEPTERPAHRVSLSTYYIDQHEVTVRQFVQFLKETGRPVDAGKLMAREADEPPPSEDLPAVNLSAPQARAYCNWARKQLPTEAQWEYAARSGDGRVSYWNGELPRKDPPSGSRAMEPVMTVPTDVSPFGAFDMGANAWEWTSDYYDSQYYQQFRNPVADPTGPRQSRARPAHTTVRGGSKIGVLTWRDGQKSETRLPFLGFRGALPVEGPPVAPASAPTTTRPPGNPDLPGGVIPF
jgi:sulfatase modifying factor 1